MKRTLLFALVFAMCLSVFAGTLSGDVVKKYYNNEWNRGSWAAGYYTDEFGDETDEAYLYYIGKGSYTTESSVDSSTFYYIITDDSEGISFYLLSSFGSNLADNSIKGTFEIAYKVDSTTTRASGVFGTKKAVFTETSASDSFRKALESGKDFKVLITQDGTVFESKKFNLGAIKNSTYKTAWDTAYCYTIKYLHGPIAPVDSDVWNFWVAIDCIPVIGTDKVMKGEKATIMSGSYGGIYEFIDWHTSPNGMGQSYKMGEEIIPNNDLVLCAHLTIRKGPTGGYLFYDCDSDNDSGNADGLISTECGWRYLEAAPSDLSGEYIFGYYMPDGRTRTKVGTETGIGTGKSNTEALVKAMGDTDTTKAEYAAKACDTYSIEVDGVTYDDWFLPSKDELNLMYKKLYTNGLGSLKNSDYLSSSEHSYYDYAWVQGFSSGYQFGNYREGGYYVRPIRAFL